MARFYKAPLSPRYYRFGAQPIRWAAGWRGQAQAETRSMEARELGDASFVDSFYNQTYDQNLQKSYRVLSTPRVGSGVMETGGPRFGSPEPLSPQMYPLSGFTLTTPKIIAAVAVVAAIIIAKKK